MGEELKLNQLYMKVGDGEYVPFEVFKPADIVCVDEMDEELYNFLPQSGTINCSFTILHKECRRWKKYFHALANKFRREVRTRERRKEKLRRRALKAGFKMYHGYLVKGD